MQYIDITISAAWELAHNPRPIADDDEPAEQTVDRPKKAVWLKAASLPVVVEGEAKECWPLIGAPGYVVTEHEVLRVRSRESDTVTGKRIGVNWFGGRRTAHIYIEGMRLAIPIEVLLIAGRFGKPIGHKRKLQEHRRKRH
jgi:hypothetical protein